MSTDRKKKKRSIPRFEWIKIIEYGCIGLVLLLFLGLAILYGSKNKDQGDTNAETSPSPVPTEDSAIRGKNIFEALEKASFSVTYGADHYAVQSPSGIDFIMRMESDNEGISELSFETCLCADPGDETEASRLLRKKNRDVTDALRSLFDSIMPVFRRTVTDSDTIVKQCQNVVKDGDSYSKHFGRYSIRILSDPDTHPQTVTVSLIRDP